jgi:Mrp family chromosome partitioning ATPase
MEKLAQASAPVVGIVLNKASGQGRNGYYGRYQPIILPTKASARASGNAESFNSN